jgi:uncharacterized protein YqeY
MSIVTNIREELKNAMKAKDQVALDTYRGVLSAFTNELVSLGKTPQDELSDTESQKVISRLVKQRKDAIEQFTTGGRADLADNEKAQLALLEKFLPAQMSEEKVMEIAKAVKEKLGVTDKSKSGQLVGAVMKEVAGQADGGVVKKVVESLF